MSITPKTIQIFLPGGDPRGIRVSELTTRIVQVIAPSHLSRPVLSIHESTSTATPTLPIGTSRTNLGGSRLEQLGNSTRY